MNFFTKISTLSLRGARPSIWRAPWKKHLIHPSEQSSSPAPPELVVGKLKEEEGGMIWLVGGREISQLLIAADLVDELIVSVHPKILVRGIPLVASMDAQCDLKLVTYEVFKSGLVQLRYEIIKNKNDKSKKARAARVKKKVA